VVSSSCFVIIIYYICFSFVFGFVFLSSVIAVVSTIPIATKGAYGERGDM
jgi:hypothetical protein